MSAYLYLDKVYLRSCPIAWQNFIGSFSDDDCDYGAVKDAAIVRELVSFNAVYRSRTGHDGTHRTNEPYIRFKDQQNKTMFLLKWS